MRAPHGVCIRSREPQRVTIIITDDDVRRLLPMQDCIEAMRVAFRDFANGSAVNRPRMRYLAQHPDPGRKYLANVHVGAVPSPGIARARHRADMHIGEIFTRSEEHTPALQSPDHLA